MILLFFLIKLEQDAKQVKSCSWSPSFSWNLISWQITRVGIRVISVSFMPALLIFLSKLFNFFKSIGKMGITMLTDVIWSKLLRLSKGRLFGNARAYMH